MSKGKRVLRESIAREQGWRCYLCGIKMSRKKNGRGKVAPQKARFKWSTLDHVIPKAKGGTDKRENINVACFSCNTLKDNMDIIDFFEKYSIKDLKEMHNI